MVKAIFEQNKKMDKYMEHLQRAVETGEATEDGTRCVISEIVQEKKYRTSLKELPNMMEIQR